MFRNIEEVPVPVGYWLAADGRNPHTTPLGVDNHGGRFIQAPSYRTAFLFPYSFAVIWFAV